MNTIHKLPDEAFDEKMENMIEKKITKLIDQNFKGLRNKNNHQKMKKKKKMEKMKIKMMKMIKTKARKNVIIMEREGNKDVMITG